MSQRPERPKNIFDDPRLVVWGEKNPETNKYPRAMLLNFNDKIRLRVYSSVEADKNLEIKLELIDALQLVEMVEAVARNPAIEQKYINYEGFIPGAEKKRGVIGTVIVGRANDGYVFIGATKYGWNKAQICKFSPSFGIKRVDKTGNPVSDDVVSSSKALAWCAVVRKLIQDEFSRDWRMPERRGGNSNNSNNSNNGYNQNNSQYNQQVQSQSFDEDVLF